MTGTATTAVSHYSFGGLRFAVKRGTALHHLHGDHLGSTSLTTDTAGAATASRAYYAYGAERSSTGELQTDRTFTGQKRDATGLMYYNARYYDPALGTFVSPDSLVPDPGMVIDYNRFLYVRGNPLRFSDPTGYCRVDSNGNWQFATDCNLEEFNALSWEWRKRWMQDFMDNHSKGQYFDNIIGIIEYFQSDPVFWNSEWARLSDAGVLLAIQDGHRVSIEDMPMGDYVAFMRSTGKESPAVSWSRFLKTVHRETADLSLWGKAEQLGVDFGTFVAAPVLKDPDAIETVYAEYFKGWGDIYRIVVSSGVPNLFAPENCTLRYGCSVWTLPSFLIHPSHSRAFVRLFSRSIVSPSALRGWLNKHGYNDPISEFQ